MASELDVTYDLVCPFCFVGLTRLQRAFASAAADGADLRLWAYQLLPDVPDGGVDQRKHFAQRFGEDRLPDIYARMGAMASAEGLSIDYEKMRVLPNTRRAHQTVAAADAGPKRLKLAVALMTAHFSKGRNIGEREVLEEIARPYLDAGQSLEAVWKSETAAKQMDAARDRAGRLGIRSVPHFMVDGRALPSTPTQEEMTALTSKAQKSPR